MIGDLLDAKVDIATVAQMMGQSDINTTKRYDRKAGASEAAGGATLAFTIHKTGPQRGRRLTDKSFLPNLGQHTTDVRTAIHGELPTGLFGLYVYRVGVHALYVGITQDQMRSRL